MAGSRGRSAAGRVRGLLAIAAALLAAPAGADDAFAIEAVVAAGDPSPGGAPFRGFAGVHFQEDGSIVFGGQLESASFGSGIFVADRNGLATVVAPGDPASDGGTVSTAFLPEVNRSGGLLWLENGERNALVRDLDGVRRVIARAGDTLSGGNGAITRIRRFALGDAGEVLVRVTTSSRGELGLLLDTGDGLEPYVLTGDPIAGTDGLVHSFAVRGISAVGFAGDGTPVFLSGTNGNRPGAHADDRPIALPGDPAPAGLPGQIESAIPCAVNRPGHVVYFATLVGSDAPTGLFLDRDGVAEAIALEGQEVTLRDGSTLADARFGCGAPNDLDQVLVTASQRLPTGGREELVLLVWSDGEFVELMRSGDRLADLAGELWRVVGVDLDERGDAVLAALMLHDNVAREVLILARRRPELEARRRGRGARVALFGSPHLAVDPVEPGSVGLSDGTRPRDPVHRRDVDGDGLSDLVLRFDRAPDPLCLVGESEEGRPFEACTDLLEPAGRPARTP